VFESVICCYRDAVAFRRYVKDIISLGLILNLPNCLFQSVLIIFLPLVFPTKILYALVPCECFMCCPSHPSLFHRPDICISFSLSATDYWHSYWMNPKQLALACFVFSPPSEAKDTCDSFLTYPFLLLMRRRNIHTKFWWGNVRVKRRLGKPTRR
jgi:hypothetical protein